MKHLERSTPEQLDFQLLFESAPGMYLVLSPDLEIVAASAAYLQATMTDRADIIGRDFFDVFPDNPDDPEASGVRNLSASLERVLRLGQADTMPLQKYDIRRPGGGGFEERYWSPSNTPVLGSDGRVAYVIHHVEDVTEIVKLERRGAEQEQAARQLRAHSKELKTELVLWERELAERRRMEAELRDSSTRLLAVFDNMTEGVVIADLDGRVLHWNRAALDMHDLSSAAEWCLLLPEFRKHFELAALDGKVISFDDWPMARLLRGERLRDCVLRVRRLGADWQRTFSYGGALVPDASGRQVAFLTCNDVTARVQTQEQLAREKAFADELLESQPGLIYLIDEQGRIVRWNRALETVTGYAAEELRGKPALELVPADEQIDIGNRLRAVFSEGQATAECHVLARDGRTTPHLMTGRRLHTADGVFCLGIGVDISARKRAEDMLRESEAHFRAMANTAPVIIWITDADGQATFINEQWRQFTGQALPESLGYGWLDKVHEADRAAAGAVWQAARAQRAPYRNEYRLRHRDGSFRTVLSTAQPRFDAKGEFLGHIGCVLDISEHKALEEQLRQAQKMEAVGQLAGGVAHDFNNLLTIINGYSEIIQGQLPADSPIRPLVRQIAQAGERATSLTRQLLAFSRKQVLEPRVLSLNTVIADVSKMLTRLIGEDVVLTTVLEPALGLVKADPGQVEQVIFNLAVNARDAMPQGGRLTIETANVDLDDFYTRAHPDLKPGPYAMLALSDTGCGMDHATKARIFEPFFTTKGKGTGLGLATVFGIVKQSEGHIAVYSEPGQGATFKIYLPLVEQTARVSAQPSSAASLEGAETILLAEDESVVRALTTEILESYGYQVLAAAGGGQALRLAREHPGPIHLLLTDVVMPAMSGRQLAEELRALRPDTRLLFLSGYTDDAVFRHGVLEAETAFLQKPFTPTGLARKVREVLDR